MRIEFHPDAAEEAVGARQWYAGFSDRIGRRFQKAYDRTFDRIIDNPRLWPKGMHRTRFLRIERYPYVVIYRHRQMEIIVIAVAHTSRKPGYWKDRLAP
jgi:plasmid stabilization system protein ParE